MIPEDQLLCLCTRQDFTPLNKKRLYALIHAAAIDWGRVLETADLNQVSPLVYTNLQVYSNEFNGVPAETLRLFKQRYMHNVIVKKRTAEIIEAVLRFLTVRHIPAMLLKGAALDASVYRQPWYTSMADVDLILRSKREDLSKNERWQIDEWFGQFNLQTNPYKLHLEYDFYSHHDMTMNDLIEVDIEGTWKAARETSLHGQPVWIMSPEDLLIASAINSCRKRYFRLKSACDVTAIIEAYPQLDWETVVAKARAYRCNAILYACFFVTHIMLETPFPETIWRDLRVHPVRAKLIRFLSVSLLRYLPLSKLARNKEGKILEREPGWGLILTYASYRLDQIVPKLRRLMYIQASRLRLALRSGEINQ